IDDRDIEWIDEGESFAAKGIEKVPAFHPAGAETLRAHAPKRANGPIVLERPGATLTLHAAGARDVSGAVKGDSIVYEDAWPGVDLVLLAKRGMIEDLRVVRTAAALASLRTKLSLPAHVEPGGDIVVANLFRAAAPTAVDAQGHALAVESTIEGDQLSLHV